MARRTAVRKETVTQTNKPTTGGATVVLGQPLRRSRASTLFIDDVLFAELRGEKAIKTIDRMLADPIVAGATERTSLMLRSVDWTVRPGMLPQQTEADDRSKEFSDRIAQDMADLETGWKSVVAGSADMIGWGFSLFETLFRREEDGYHWADFSPRDQRSIIGWDLEPGTGALLAARQRVESMSVAAREGLAALPGGIITLPGWKLLHFRTHPASGRPEGRSLVRNAFLPWTDKQELRRIVKLGLRRDFTGVAKLQVPPEMLDPAATAEQKAALAQAEALVREFERDEREGIVIPAEKDTDGKDTGWKLELMGPAGRRQLELEQIWGIHNREISVALLAEFMLMGTDETGNRSLGESKIGFFARAITSWLDIIAEFMGHKAARVYQALNPQYAGAALPVFEHGDVDEQSITEFVASIAQLVSSATLTPEPALEEFVRKRLHIPVVRGEESL